MKELGAMGFRPRMPAAGDPVVCQTCGATVGIRPERLEDLAAALERMRTDHMVQCKERLAVQAASRGSGWWRRG